MTDRPPCSIALRHGDHRFALAAGAVLPAAEREWCAARRSADRWLGRLAVRDAVASYSGSTMRTVAVDRDPEGAPHLRVAPVDTGSRQVTDRLAVSIAHDRSHGGAVVAAPDVELGLDLVAGSRAARWSEADAESLCRRIASVSERSGLVDAAEGAPAPVMTAAVVAAKEAIGKATRRRAPQLRWRHVELVPDDGAGRAEDDDRTRHWWPVWRWAVPTHPGLAGRVDVFEDGLVIGAVAVIDRGGRVTGAA